MTSPDSIPKELGDFEILRQLGRGGMGIVYEARQKSLNRRVALKVLSSGLGLTARAVQRFRREAEAAARLHHTNIVPIYATGEDKGVHFYAMELVDGPSLYQVIHHMRAGRASADSGDEETESTAAEPMPDWVAETVAYAGPRVPADSAAGSEVSRQISDSGSASGSRYFDTVAAMMADVAEALEHAHEQGVIHRDIKPSNLLLSPDGRLSINDFGLARVLEQPGMTMSGEFVGTPRYMSPEQITAGRAPLDHRTDIYSLGATLYELLTLQPPFPGQSRDEVIAQILHKEPKSPKSWNRSVPTDLETICLKAIERDPDRRYKTATALASDLRAYVNRHAISARRIGPVGRAGKWARRKPTAAALLLVLLLSTCAVGVLLRQMYVAESKRAEEATNRAQELAVLYIMQGDLDRAVEQCDTAEHLGAPHHWVERTRGHIELYRGNHNKALDHLDEADRLSPQNTATRSLRAILHFHVGEEHRYFFELNDLQQAEPRTWEDHFYLGLAQMWGNPQEALTNLEQAYQDRRGSPAIRLPLAYAHWQCAMDCPEVREARTHVEVAIRHAEECLERWPDHGFASAILVQALLTAANISDDVGDEPARDEYMERAGEAVTSLETSQALVDPIVARYHFLQHSEPPHIALEYICEAANTVEMGRNYTAAYGVIAWFRREDREAAERTFQLIDESGGNLKESFRILAALGADPDQAERQRLLQSFRGVLARERGDFNQVITAWMVLRLLEAEESEWSNLARQGKDFFDEFQSPMQHNLTHVCDFLAGGVDANELIQCCQQQGSKRLMATAYFAIAADALANGDRLKAIEYFQNCVDQHVYQFYVHQWSLAFLDKLKKQPTWPNWIAPLSVESEPSGAASTMRDRRSCDTVVQLSPRRSPLVRAPRDPATGVPPGGPRSVAQKGPATGRSPVTGPPASGPVRLVRRAKRE